MARATWADVHWLATDLTAVCGVDDQRDGYSSDPSEATCHRCRAEAWWELARARSRVT